MFIAGLDNPFIWVAIVLVALLVFGNRIPEMMRSMGRGKREFELGMRGDQDDELRKEREREAEVRRRVEEQMRREEEEKRSAL